MKQTIDIKPSHSLAFNAGQSGKFLILRQASQSVLLKGDALRPVELERGDVVDISQFDELEIYNHNSTSVHVEFQVSDIEVRIRTASTAIDGGLDIHGIQSPVTIDRIQEPLDIQVHIPEIEVSIPDVDVSLPDQLEIANFPDTPDVQKVHVVQETAPSLAFVALGTMTESGTIDGNTNRKELILKSSDSSTGTIWLGGYENKGYGLRPGEGFILSNGASMDVYIPADSTLFLSEVRA